MNGDNHEKDNSFVLAMLATVAHGKKFKVKNCDAAAMQDINWATDFIDDNIDDMLSQATFIPSRYTDKLKKKWPSTTLKCSTKKSVVE